MLIPVYDKLKSITKKVIFDGIDYLLFFEEKITNTKYENHYNVVKNNFDNAVDACNKFYNNKVLDLIPKILKTKFDISPGALIKTNNKTYVLTQYTSELVVLNSNATLLYLGFEFCEKENIVYFKFLENKTMYRYRKHKNQNLFLFLRNFGTDFTVIKKSN
jgi:hypothetical protein